MVLVVAADLAERQLLGLQRLQRLVERAGRRPRARTGQRGAQLADLVRQRPHPRILRPAGQTRQIGLLLALQQLEAQHHAAGKPARIATVLRRRQGQHHVLEGRLRGDELAAHGAGLGAVEFLADPAEQMRLHLLQHPYRLRPNGPS